MGPQSTSSSSTIGRFEPMYRKKDRESEREPERESERARERERERERSLKLWLSLGKETADESKSIHQQESGSRSSLDDLSSPVPQRAH